MLTAQNIRLQYGERVLLDGVSLQVKPGDRIGLTGRNGAGKSTLLKIIARRAQPDSGQVQQPPDYSIGYLAQEMDLPLGKSVREEAATAFSEVLQIADRLAEINVELAEATDHHSKEYEQLLIELSNLTDRFGFLEGDRIDARAEVTLKGLGFLQEELDRPLGTFSGGWRMRVELAKILLSRPDLILLDEPTNHLDIESIRWLEVFMQDYPGALIVVSHDRIFLDKVTKSTVEIVKGKSFEYKGNFTAYEEERERRRETMMAQKKNQDKYVAHTEQLINKFRAKNTKATFAQSLIKKLNKLDRIELDDEDRRSLNIRFPEPPRAGKSVFRGKNITKRYDDNLVLNGIDFELGRTEKVAFVGRNGEGKTTLARIIGGDLPAEGEIALGHKVMPAMYAQHTADMLDPALTVLETIDKAAPPEMASRSRAILGAFLFSGEDVEKQVKVLSGGERARLALAKMLLQPANLLVLDEPTNHLDMIAKGVLKDAINNYTGAVVVVSHDRDFLDGLTHKTYLFRRGTITEYLTDIRDFEIEESIAPPRETMKSNQSVPEKQGPGLSNKERYNLKKELRSLSNRVSKLERRVTELEAEIADTNEKLQDADFYAKVSTDPTFFEKYEALRTELEQVMQEWTEEAERLDEAKSQLDE